MKVAFYMNKSIDSAMFGDVIEEKENHFVVVVTSYMKARFKKYLGSKVLVLKSKAQKIN